MSEENKSLITLAKESNQLEVMLLESGGEVTPEIEAMLTVKEVNLPSKVDNYYHVMHRLDGLEIHYKEMADKFQKAAKTFSGASKSLKDRLKIAMRELGEDEIKGNDFRFKLSNSKPSLIIEDDKVIPKDYFVQVTETVLEKDRLLEDLKIGEVAGARLEPSFSLRSYVNTPKATKKAKGE